MLCFADFAMAASSGRAKLSSAQPVNAAAAESRLPGQPFGESRMTVLKRRAKRLK
ncbi:MAG: hypothetical protein HDT14_13475 [Oscillibacter sp.]|nr:hypothetical protein [Oscillibacter sp.]